MAQFAIVPRFVAFSVKTDLDTGTVTDDIAQCHADQLFDPASRLIGVYHEVLVTPSVPGSSVWYSENCFKLFLIQVFQFRVSLAFETVYGFRFQVELG